MAGSEEASRLGRITRIGSYALGRKLGEGSFAVVREARHIPTDEAVAIKLFDKRAIDLDYVRSTLQREGAILQRLRHPHIIDVSNGGGLAKGFVVVSSIGFVCVSVLVVVFIGTLPCMSTVLGACLGRHIRDADMSRIAVVAKLCVNMKRVLCSHATSCLLLPFLLLLCGLG